MAEHERENTGRETSPTARALMALELLQERPGISALELGKRLGVTDRAARRYVAVLREAGVPVESERGRYGGYRVGRGLRLPPLVFSSAEALALVMAVLDAHHHPDDPDDPVATALHKIVRALPAKVAEPAAAVRRQTAATPSRGDNRPDPHVTTSLVQASAERRQVCIGYCSESGREWRHVADPWSVVVRFGRWYLLCWSHQSQERRAYRVDRITDVSVLDSTFAPPEDLDPVADLESHLAEGWEFEAEVELDMPVAQARHWIVGTRGRLESLGPDRCRLVGSTNEPHEYLRDLVRLPCEFRLVGGPELVDAAQAMSERLRVAAPSQPQPS